MQQVGTYQRLGVNMDNTAQFTKTVSSKDIEFFSFSSRLYLRHQLESR